MLTEELRRLGIGTCEAHMQQALTAGKANHAGEGIAY